jgi:hypothetical protein
MGTSTYHLDAGAPYEAPLEAGTPSTGATTDRCEPGVTAARSPMLTVNSTIKGRHEDIAGHTIDQ